MPANPLIIRTTLTTILYSRWMLAPSSIAGKVKCVSRDGALVTSILPDGEVSTNPNTPEHDGPYEAAVEDKGMLAYDYEGLTAPVVFSFVVMG